MSDDFEIVEVSQESTWSRERKEEYTRMQQIVRRLEHSQTDITSTDSQDLFHIANSCRVFGLKGEELFLSICKQRPGYNEDNAKIYYNTEISKKPYKGISKIIALCKDHNVSTRITKKEPEQQDDMRNFLPEGADDTAADDLEEYGFFTMHNQYYSMVKGASGFESKPFTNFTMKVLFHMNNGESPRRVIEFVNYRKKKKVIDVETTALTGVGKFMELVEGLGNFLFYGNAAQLNAIKRKVFDEEGNCTQLSNLGWMENEQLWVWGNGVFLDGKFLKADKEGFIMNGDDNYYVASANMSIPNRRNVFANHLKFWYQAHDEIVFNAWAKHYFKVYGLLGMPVMLHTLSCLFSDIIFEVMNGFPLLFIYGEGGSGKGSSIKAAQRLLGSPQEPLKISGSNTDKSKIRTFAQFVNSMIFLDEYVPNDLTDELLKGLWDRYGYKRATKDHGYNTESVPIQSGVAVAGNYIPYNEPLLTRMVLLTNNKNEYTQEEKETFAWFEDWSSKGCCNVTHEVLSKRKYVEDNYKQLHRENAKMLMELREGKESISRMIENYAVQLTMHDILTGMKFELPFTKATLQEFLVSKCLRPQNELRNNDNDFGKFWEVCGSLISQKQMVFNNHYKTDGDVLYVLTGLLYPLWLQEYYKIYRKMGPGKNTMMSKLENKSRGFLEHFKSARVGDNNSSGSKFSLKLLPSDFVDQVRTAESYHFGKVKEDEVPTNPTNVQLPFAKTDDVPF